MGQAGADTVRILSLCDLTGNMARPWSDAGHDVVLIDVQRDESQDLLNAEVRQCLMSRTWDFVIAQPPCTHLASSGARWWASKGLGPLIEGLRMVSVCVEIATESGAPWMLENPVGRLSTCWREPDYIFDPWEYAGYDAPGDHYTKRTCLWTGGGFVMPAPKFALTSEAPDKTRIHHESPGPDRANRRSAAPMGFARAVYEANVTSPDTP